VFDQLDTIWPLGFGWGGWSRVAHLLEHFSAENKIVGSAHVENGRENI
jgi:hypothetical protein